MGVIKPHHDLQSLARRELWQSCPRRQQCQLPGRIQIFRRTFNKISTPPYIWSRLTIHLRGFRILCVMICHFCGCESSLHIFGYEIGRHVSRGLYEWWILGFENCMGPVYQALYPIGLFKWFFCVIAAAAVAQFRSTHRGCVIPLGYLYVSKEIGNKI